MKIRIHGMLGTSHSWAYTQQYLARAIVNAGGHDLFLKSTNNLEHFPEDLKKYLLPGYHGYLVQGGADYLDGQGNEIIINKDKPAPEVEDTNKPYDLELCYTIPIQWARRFYRESKCRAAIWNFESSILPPGWQMYSRALDYILPSSQYSYDIFANNGIPKDKMVVVPHGVDLNIFNPNITPFKLQTTKKVKFLHNAIPHHRKLHERVIKGFVDTFTGDDDVCLVLKTKFLTPTSDKPFEIDVKVILEEALKGVKNPPEIEVINNKFIDDIGSLYTACDVVVSMSSCEGFCLLPGTPIDTSDGPVVIENVKSGSTTLSYEGNMDLVTEKTERNVDEDIIGIRRHGNSEIFWGTKNHPHLIYKKDDKRLDEIRKEYIKSGLKLQWVGLSEIEKGDLVVIPKPKLSHIEDNVTSLKISDYVGGLKSDDMFVWNNHSIKYGKNKKNVTMEDVANKSGHSISSVSSVLNNKNNNPVICNNVINVANNLNFTLRKAIKHKNCVNLTPELMEVFGLYIAEGSLISGANTLHFASHKNEHYARNLEKNTLNKCWGLESKIFFRKNKGELISFDSTIAKLFGNLFGTSSVTKKIPTFLWKSKYIGDLIRGVFYGDGHFNKKKHTCSFSTSSKRLASDIFQICLHHNIFLNIMQDTRKQNINYILSVNKSYESRFEDFAKPIKYNEQIVSSGFCKYNYTIETEDYFLVPVVKIMKKHYSGNVYNLHVKKTKSFTSGGMITHNCLPLLEALACDKLIIAPRHGGQLDFLNDDNSLLVDTGEMEAPASHQYWGYMKGAVVGDPSIEHYKELLVHAYKNIDAEKARVKDSARKTVEHFSWERAAQMILDLPIPKKSMRIPDKKKVLYIIPYKMVGGGEVWVRQAIKQLDRTIYEPHVALISGTEESFQQSLIDLGAKIEDLSGPVGRDRALKCLIEAENYSIIHFYNSFGIYRVLQEAWSQGFRCRIVETVHSELNWNDSMMKVSNRGEHIAAIAAVSNQMGRKLLKMGNKNVVVLPQQIDWGRFKVPRSKNILDELNICGNFVVGFVGRLSPEKNIPVILHCAKNLPDVSFVIVGDGPQKQPLEQMANGLHNVHFVGARNDVEKFYAAFDLLILPSVMEGMPLVILEAMVAGTPTIASDVGSILEVVFDGITGSLIWNPGNPNLFIREIQRLKNNHPLWERCSFNCKAVADAAKDKASGFNINHFYNLLF